MRRSTSCTQAHYSDTGQMRWGCTIALIISNYTQSFKKAYSLPRIVLFCISEVCLQSRRVSAIKDSHNLNFFPKGWRIEPENRYTIRDKLGVKRLNLKSVVGPVEAVLAWEDDVTHRTEIHRFHFTAPQTSGTRQAGFKSDKIRYNGVSIRPPGCVP